VSAKTGISWTDRTWNPVVGCTKVSQGCKHCYAKTLHDMRHKAFTEGKLQNIAQYALPFETVQALPERLADPFGWRKPARVFVNSMSDLFHEDIPDEFIARVFAVMFLAERHTFQVLTKRPERMQRLLSADSFRDAILDEAEPLWERTAWAEDDSRSYEDWCSWLNGDGLDGEMPGNIWLGVSVENQGAADERIPLLLQTSAAVRFLSCEPLLGPVDLQAFLWREMSLAELPGHALNDGATAGIARLRPGLDWVIPGGESGKGARPMHPDWALSLRDQCVAAGVAFHFKQWGEFREYDVGIEPGVELVYTGTVTADAHAACAINPLWVDPQGNPFIDPDNLPEETPCRLLERVGAKRAGRVLDGRTWDDFPAVRA
jgi:protein gp37